MSRRRNRRSHIVVNGVLCKQTPVLIDWRNGSTQHCVLVTPITTKKESN